jgi:PAS domain S-box-containing protein
MPFPPPDSFPGSGALAQPPNAQRMRWAQMVLAAGGLTAGLTAGTWYAAAHGRELLASFCSSSSSSSSSCSAPAAARRHRRARKSSLRALVDTANAPIFGIDKDGNVNEWNNKAAEITEYAQTEVMGRNLVDEFITAEYKVAVKAVLDAALRATRRPTSSSRCSPRARTEWRCC